MKYYVAAVARLNGNTDDTVKLGYMTFYASAHGSHYGSRARRVAWNGWAWRRGAHARSTEFCGPICAEGIGTWVGSDCAQTGAERRYCPFPEEEGEFANGLPYQQAAVGELRAALRFKDPTTENRAGDYYVVDLFSAKILHILWDDGEVLNWILTTDGDGIQKLELFGSSENYHEAIAAGSNVPTTQRVHPSNMLGHSQIAGIQFDAFETCSTATWVLNESHHVSNGTSLCSCFDADLEPNPHSYVNNWIARVGTSDRRDVWHSWCQCLANHDDWYDGGSHQRMLLQAIDEDAEFRGWVGVQVDRDFSHSQLLNDLLDF